MSGQTPLGLLTAEQAAKIAGVDDHGVPWVTPGMLAAARLRGELPGYRVGRRAAYTEMEVRAWLVSHPVREMPQGRRTQRGGGS